MATTRPPVLVRGTGGGVGTGAGMLVSMVDMTAPMFACSGCVSRGTGPTVGIHVRAVQGVSRRTRRAPAPACWGGPGGRVGSAHRRRAVDPPRRGGVCSVDAGPQGGQPVDADRVLLGPVVPEVLVGMSFLGAVEEVPVGPELQLRHRPAAAVGDPAQLDDDDRTLTARPRFAEMSTQHLE